MKFDLVIKNGTCILPSGEVLADIAIESGKIVEIGKIDSNLAAKTINASGLHVLPGIIDSQVHFREPGLEHKEDLAHGTKAAILGGVTSIFEMPNTNPPTTSKDALADKLQRASKTAWCNYAFFVGGTPDPNINWHELEMLPGCAGIKIFMGSSTGSLLVAEDEALTQILSQTTRRVAVHAEDEQRLKQRHHIAIEGAHPKYHPIWRDEQTALFATTRILRIARTLAKQIHVLHVTTKEEMELLAKNKDIATVESLPQHLTFNSSDYDRLGTRLQMNPPIRAQEHQDALWHALNVGIIDVIGSDHAPHTLEEKAKTYPNTPSGMPGVQTILPIMLNFVNQGKLSLLRLVDLLSTGPARVYQAIGKGRIAVGYDGDITIVDMNKTYTIDDKDMATKCKWTPFHGMTIKGKAIYTIIGGRIVMQEDEIIGIAGGKAVKFIPTLRGK